MSEQLQTFQLSPNPDSHHHHRVLLYGMGALLLLIIAGGGGYLFGIRNTQPPIHASQPFIAAYPSETPTLQKSPQVSVISLTPAQGLQTFVYTNQQYGLQITLPKVGTLVDQQGNLAHGICGKAIKQVKDLYGVFGTQTIDNIDVDNFFVVDISTASGSINDYINKQDPQHIRITIPVVNSGADEAVQLSHQDNPNISFTGPEPLGYVEAIYRKNNLLFVIGGTQNPANYGGCVAVDTNSIIDPTTALKFVN